MQLGMVYRHPESRLLDIVDADRQFRSSCQRLIGHQIQFGKHFAQHHPTAMAGHTDVAVLSVPTQTRPCRDCSPLSGPYQRMRVSSVSPRVLQIRAGLESAS